MSLDEETARLLAELDDFEPETEAQRVFVEQQRVRSMTGDSDPVPAHVVILTIVMLCRTESPTAEDLGRAAFLMMLLGAERDALRQLLIEAGFKRKGNDS